METLEIRKIELVEDKNLTLASWFRLEDGNELANGTWEMEGQLSAEEVLEKGKTMVDEGIEVSLNLTGQASDAGDSNSEEGKEEPAPETPAEPAVDAAPDAEGTTAPANIQAVEVHDAEGKLVKTFIPENGEDFVEQAKKFAVEGGYTIGYK